MSNNIKEIERKLHLSFHYAKKDILRLNDAIQDINKKIQHLSLNQAMLLEKISLLQKRKK